jgi:hypothetical protein
MYLFTDESPPDDALLTYVVPADKELEPFAVDPSCIAYRSLLYKEKEQDRDTTLFSDATVAVNVSNNGSTVHAANNV